MGCGSFHGASAKFAIALRGAGAAQCSGDGQKVKTRHQSAVNGRGALFARFHSALGSARRQIVVSALFAMI